MRIIYTIEDFSIKGGAENIIAQKANTLVSAYHHEVTIVSIYQDNRPPSYPLVDGVKLVSLNIPFVQKNGNPINKLINRMAVMLKAIGRFQEIVNKTNPDIIFFTMSMGALMLPFCKTKAKKIYESHSAKIFTPYHKLFFLTERKANAIVCLTQGDAKEYNMAKKVEVIPNFIERHIHTVIDYSVKKAIAVGRLESPKGFDILINCWQTIAGKHPDWHLDIYGEGSLRENLQSQINRLGLSNYITLCGRSNNIMEMYTRYSLHIMSSRYEGQPMTLIEAQSCGLPSVVTDFKFGASDIVKNNFNGLIVKQNDYKALADAIDTIMESEDMRRQYGTNAQNVGKQYYKENVFGRWLSLISSLQ